MNRTSVSFALVSLLALVACGGSSTADAPVVTIDAPALPIDAPALPIDAGHIVDAPPDAPPDGAPDATPPDAAPDAAPDATPPPDAAPGTPDARILPPDARPPDAHILPPDAHVIPDAHPAPDAAPPSLNGCTAATAADHTNASTVTVNFGGTGGSPSFGYAPSCIKVSTGTMVTFAGPFGSHPFVTGKFTGTGTSSTPTPFTNTSTGTTKTFTMTTAGTYGYYCSFHAGSSQMYGAVIVE